MISPDTTLASVLVVKRFPGSFPLAPIPGASIAQILNEGTLSSPLVASAFPNSGI